MSVTPDIIAAAQASQAKWLPVVGYEGRYEVSDHGEVRSLRRRVGKWHDRERDEPLILKLQRNSYTGYWHCALSDGETKTTRSIHRLVLAAFVGPCPLGMEGLHADGDRNHNDLSNLSWGTHSANELDKKGHGTSGRNGSPGSRNGNAILNEDDIRCIRAEPRWKGVGLMLAKCFGVTPGTITAVRRGEVWSHVVQ